MRVREFAKELRGQQTEAELRRWYRLPAHRFLGLKFERQKPVLGYIVDFISAERGVVIELDGGQHNESEYDRERDSRLAAEGLTVLRFWNDEVLKDTDAVLEKIRQVIDPTGTLLSPLPLVGEGGASATGEGAHDGEASLSPNPSPTSGRGE